VLLSMGECKLQNQKGGSLNQGLPGNFQRLLREMRHCGGEKADKCLKRGPLVGGIWTVRGV